MNRYGFMYGMRQRGHIYEWISMANHSCDPNASAVPGFPGILRAVRDIPEGEEVTINYGKKKAKFKCRCEACEGRRARYSLGISSTDGSAGDYIKRKARGFRMSRSSVEISAGDEDDGDGDGPSPGWFGNTASTLRRLGRGKKDSTSGQDDDSESPAQNTHSGWGGFVGSSQGGADEGEATPRLRKRLGAYIIERKTEAGRWLG